MKKACSECRINCLKLHGESEEDEDANACLYCALRKPTMVENVDRPPSFLKKITESTMSTLKLPQSFVADHTERLGDTVVLEGPGREQWRVELRRSFRSFSITFGQGWEQFVADHVLQIGDQLSLSLSENSCFQVEVYDGFGVQKRSALDATNTSLSHKNVKNVGLKDLHIGVDVATIARQEEHQDNPENALQSAEQLLIDLIQSSESESRVVSVPGNELREIAEADGDRPALELVEINKGGGSFLPPQTLVCGKVVSQRRPVTELEKVQALRGAHALGLVNPNTLIVMSKGHVYSGFWLTIPKRFAKDWLPLENKEITLVNKSGHKWPAKWLASQGGLSAGWRRFSLDHRLEEHDVCVLELIDRADHSLLVHIFRVLGGLEEDLRLYTSSSTPLRNCEGRRNTKTWTSPIVYCSPRKGQENINKFEKSTWESPAPGTKNLKRKLCLLEDDEASGSQLAKAKRLENRQDHQTVENLVNPSSVDDSGNDLDSALKPRASCDAKINAIVIPQFLRASCTDLVKLAENLLTKKGLEDINPLEAKAVSADEVHEQISNFEDVSVHEGDRHTYQGRKDRGQLYKVVSIYRGRNVGNNTDFLAEIQGCTEGHNATTLYRDKDTGFLWIPSDRFEWDMLHCRIDQVMIRGGSQS